MFLPNPAAAATATVAVLLSPTGHLPPRFDSSTWTAPDPHPTRAPWTGCNISSPPPANEALAAAAVSLDAGELVESPEGLQDQGWAEAERGQALVAGSVEERVPWRALENRAPGKSWRSARPDEEESAPRRALEESSPRRARAQSGRGGRWSSSCSAGMPWRRSSRRGRGSREIGLAGVRAGGRSGGAARPRAYVGRGDRPSGAARPEAEEGQGDRPAGAEDGQGEDGWRRSPGRRRTGRGRPGLAGAWSGSL